MKRVMLLLGYFCLVLMPTGCDDPDKAAASIEGIKIGELAPIRPSGSSGGLRIEANNFNFYTFEMPAGGIEQLAQEVSSVPTGLIHFGNRHEFESNGFGLALMRLDDWGPVARLLETTGAKRTGQVALLLPKEKSSEVYIARIKKTMDIFYHHGRGPSMEGFSAKPGKLLLRIRAAEIPAMRGVCNLYSRIVFVPRDKLPFLVSGRMRTDEYNFTGLSFAAKMSPGDMLLLYPAGGTGGRDWLSSIFFGADEKAKTVKVFLLVCTAVAY